MEVEAAVREHARRTISREPEARDDLAPGAELTPPDLLERLGRTRFEGFELVAHAKIGVHHVFKTKFVGPTVIVVQARWAREAGGRWRIREAEIVRTEVGLARDVQSSLPPSGPE
jgi:hypothetical protein